MTGPGFQASQQAAQSAARAAQQNAAYGASLNNRIPHANGYRRPSGPVGLIGRLIGFVLTLVVLALAVGIFLLVFSKAQPDLFHQFTTWLHGLL
jgi:hypothetical protein